MSGTLKSSGSWKLQHRFNPKKSLSSRNFGQFYIMIKFFWLNLSSLGLNTCMILMLVLSKS